jgi:hypothetical protein
MKFLKNHPIPTVIIIVLIFITCLILCGLYLIYGSTFIQDFLANGIATFLGVIVGIPVVLWTAKYQEGAAERERRGKILRLLREELFTNLALLAGWQKSKKKDLEILTLGGMLKDESWTAFSDGGELEWIKDPKLLSDLSYTYSSIRAVAHVAEKYSSLVFSEKISGNKRQIAHYLREMLQKGIDDSCASIEEALKAIDNPTPSPIIRSSSTKPSH